MRRHIIAHNLVIYEKMRRHLIYREKYVVILSIGKIRRRIIENLPNIFSCLLEDIDPISKLFKILLDGSSGCFGARLFQKCPKHGCSKY